MTVYSSCIPKDSHQTVSEVTRNDIIYIVLNDIFVTIRTGFWHTILLNLFHFGNSDSFLFAFNYCFYGSYIV